MMTLVAVVSACEEDDDAWNTTCRPGTLDAATVIDRIESGRSSPSIAMSMTFECSRLRPDVRPEEATEAVIRYGMTHENDTLARNVVNSGLHAAVSRAGDWEWNPVPLLREAITSSRAEVTRERALGVAMFYLGRDDHELNDELAAMLLDLARQPIGPPAWPDLPAHIVRELELDEDTVLFGELRRSPHLVTYPRARFYVDCRLGAHPPPRASPCDITTDLPPLPDSTAASQR